MGTNNEMIKKQRRVAVILFMLVFLMMCMVMVGVPRELKRWVYSNNVNDKITHIFFGASFTFLANIILYPRKIRIFSIDLYWGTLIMASLFTLDELSQIPLPGRDANPLDLGASMLGLLIGYLAFYFLIVRRKKRSTETAPPARMNAQPPTPLP